MFTRSPKDGAWGTLRSIFACALGWHRDQRKVGTVAGKVDLIAVGRVDKATGSVEVVHPDGTHSALHVGDVIYKGDEISTKADGAVGITFADTSTFSLGKAGRMVIDELVFDPQAQAGQSTLSVVKGAFSFASGHIAKTAPEAAVIKTPVMTIGIRGTSGAGQADDAGGENTIVLLPDADGHIGQVLVFNSAGVQVLNSSFQQVAVYSPYQPPTPPSIIQSTVLQTLYGNTIDTRPASPPLNTPPHQIVPDFHPSTPQNPLPQQPAPTQGPAGDHPASNAPNLDHPIVLYTPAGGQPQVVTVSNMNYVLTQLQVVQAQVGNQAIQAGANVQVDQGKVAQTIYEALHQASEQLLQSNSGQTGQNQGTAGTEVKSDNTQTANNGGNGNTGPTFNGRAIDGYVANATVFRDLNNNGVQDGTEAGTTTDANGNYNLAGTGGTIVVSGGTDTTTGQPLLFTMKAAAGSSVVTPLTTLVVAVAAAMNPSNPTNTSTLAAAESSVKAMLGLSGVTASLGSIDPIATINSASGKAVLAATIEMVATINALTTAFGGSVTADNIFSAMAANSGSVLDFTNSATLTSFIAQLNGGTPPIWAASVAATLSSTNSALASVIHNASSFDSITSMVAAATSTDGGLSATIASSIIADSEWDLTDASVVKEHLIILKAAGVTTLHITQGTVTLSAAEAAGLHLQVDSTASVIVSDTGNNFATYATQLHSGCSSYVMTSNPAGTLTLAQAGALIGLVEKTGGYTLTTAGTTGTADTLNLSQMFNSGHGWQLDYFVRDGNNLKMVLKDEAGQVNTVVFTDHFNGKAVELATDGVDAVHLATDAIGNSAKASDSGDDLIFATNNSTTVAHWGSTATANTGQDKFFFGGGANFFHGNGDDYVSFASSTDALIMTGPLNNSGSGKGTLYHTNADDSLTPTYVQTFTGMQGITGTQGDDVLWGRAPSANETIPTNSSFFWISGGKGDDIIHDGGAGTTVVDYSGASGSVFINLDVGEVSGADGNDTLDGIHKVKGSAFADIITGSSENDWIDGGGGGDIIDGGDGIDTIHYGDALSGVSVDLGAPTPYAVYGGHTDSLSNIENVIGSDHADVLIGDGNANWLNGRAGNDSIDGGDGTDTVSYETYGAKNTHGVIVNLTDEARGTVAAGSAIDGWGNTDSLHSIENITGSEYADLIYGSADNNTLMGGAGNDTIYGGDGCDYIQGGAGNDILDGGGAEWDIIEGGDGNDTIIYDVADNMNGGGGTDTLLFTATATVDLSTVVASGIEVLDLSKAKVDLTADYAELDALTGFGHTLYIQGGADDTLHLGTGWEKGTSVTLSGHTYNHFTQGEGDLDLFIETSVGGGNHAPVFDTTRVIASGAETLISATDGDMGDTLHYEVITAPSHGQLVEAGNGLVYVADEGWDGTDKFEVRALDSSSAYREQTVYVVPQANTEPLEGVVALTEPTVSLINPAGWSHIDNIQLGHFSGGGEEGGEVSPSFIDGNVRAWVYLTPQADGYTGDLRVGNTGQPTTDTDRVLTFEGTIEEVNAQLAQIQYHAPTDGGPLGTGDTVHVFFASNDGVWSGSFDVAYQAVDTSFTGGDNESTDWRDDSAWTNGLPDVGDNVRISGHEVDILSPVGEQPAAIAGSVAVQDGALFIEDQLQLTGSGTVLQVDAYSTLTLSAGADLIASGTVDLAGTTELQGGMVSASHVVFSGGIATESGETEIDATVTIIRGATVNLVADSILSIAGNADNYGLIQVGQDASLEMNAGWTNAVLTNHGVLWGNGSIDILQDSGTGYLDNYGTIEVISTGGRTLTINGDVTLEDSSRLVLDIDDSGADAIAFNGGGLAELNGTVVLNSAVTPDSVGGLYCTLLSGVDGLGDYFSFSNQLTGHNTAVIKYDSYYSEVTAEVSYHTGIVSTTASADAEVILGATGHTNVVLDIGTGDIVHGGSQTDYFEVSSDDFIKVDGHGGENWVIVNDADWTGENSTYVTYEFMQNELANIDTLKVSDVDSDVGVEVDLNLQTVLGANLDQNGNSSLTVMMDGNTGGDADDVYLESGELAWTVEVDTTERNFVATNSDAGHTATVTFDETDNANNGHRLFALANDDGYGVDVYAQVFGSSASYTAGGGSDYVFGAKDISNTIANIGDGDRIYGGAQNDTFSTYAFDSGFSMVNGGGGTDQLTLTRGEGDLNFDLLDKLSGVETVIFGEQDVYSPGALELHLSAAEVNSADGHAMTIIGSSSGSNTLALEGSWTQVSASSYTSEGAMITVSGSVTVTGDIQAGTA